jgi:hypothetical protein
MNDGVKDHYSPAGLTERLKAVLGPESQPLTTQQLAALDQFHTRGLAATADLAELVGITADIVTGSRSKQQTRWTCRSTKPHSPPFCSNTSP